MDGFFGYNKIKMALEDMEKTTFIIQWGTFCYKVMPFGLKNEALFHDMMHREVEVYVDDMIAKSRADQDHVRDLKKLFERLRKYHLCLNPTKCTFEVKFGKLLGFIISEKGIKVDPDKVRAIIEMKPPQIEKELTTIGAPIFKLLKKNQKKEWNEDCQQAFEKIKDYLREPPVLVPPVDERPLIMYLTVLEESMGCILGQHDESGKRE
ncbi:Retrovirus-related Pol polyprotein from transposon 17.6, partial [Mucuna pruriens]